MTGARLGFLAPASALVGCDVKLGPPRTGTLPVRPFGPFRLASFTSAHRRGLIGGDLLGEIGLLALLRRLLGACLRFSSCFGLLRRLGHFSRFGRLCRRQNLRHRPLGVGLAVGLLLFPALSFLTLAQQIFRPQSLVELLLPALGLFVQRPFCRGHAFGHGFHRGSIRLPFAPETGAGCVGEGAPPAHLDRNRLASALRRRNLELPDRTAFQADLLRGRGIAVSFPVQAPQVRQQLFLVRVVDVLIGLIMRETRLRHPPQQSVDGDAEHLRQLSYRRFSH